LRDNNSVYEIAKALNPQAITLMNQYLFDVMRTRGGRVGSGMGTVLETLWGYNINKALREHGHDEFEIAWFPDHQYHDFACVASNNNWTPSTKEGEFFRVEAKSMVSGAADEPKAHFDVLDHELEDDDAILLLVWQWTKVDEFHVCPQVLDCFFDRAKPIASIRDLLHTQRGGFFIDGADCPDGCAPENCIHHGEPINIKGVRERRGGPESNKGPGKTSYMQNFGGMLRMLKTSKPAARQIMRKERAENSIADEFVDFIHRNFPKEELNHYTASEWKDLGKTFDIDSKKSIDIQMELLEIGREKYSDQLPK